MRRRPFRLSGWAAAGRGGSGSGIPVALLALAGFLSSAGARVMDPLLHAVATEYAVSVPDASVVFAAFALPYGLSQLVLGPVGDRFGKLRVILGALVGYAAFTGTCALAGSLPALVLLRAASGAASAGLIPVCMAYIGDAVPYAGRQVALSRFLTGVVMAQVLAGPVGGVFGDHLGWRGVFVLLAAAALALAAVLAGSMRGLPDRRGSAFGQAGYALLLRAAAARALLLAAMVEGGLLVGCFPFVAPFLHERFGLSYSLVGIVLACFGLGALLYTRLVGPMLRLLGENGIVLAGGVMMTAGLVAGFAADLPWAFAPAEVAMGMGYLMMHGVLQARATELVPSARTLSVSSFAFALFLGQSLGALLMGAAIARIGYRDSFLIDAGCIVLLGGAISAMLRRWPASSAQGPGATPAARS